VNGDVLEGPPSMVSFTV